MIFPPGIRELANAEGAKSAWISHYEGPSLTNCSNCGGSGFFVITLGMAGPFIDPPGSGIAHHDGKHWWRVLNHVRECPVCHNSPVVDPQYVEMPGAARMMDKLAKEMETA